MTDQNKKNTQILELAKRFGMEPVYDLLDYPYVKNKVHKLPYGFVKQHLALPLKEESGILFVAMADPCHLDVVEEIRYLTGYQVKEIFSTQNHLEQAIEYCYHQKERAASKYIEGLSAKKAVPILTSEDEYDLLEQDDNSPAIRLLNMIITEAIQQGASDIHLEPLDQTLSIRYRIDGVLQFRHAPPPDIKQQLSSRVKVMAKMDIAEKRLPQDGRIKLLLGGRQIDFRVSTVPVVHGERIVLRILDKSNITLGLDQIGMDPDTLSLFRKYLHQNQGIVLVTGPTGSGKTTTLYSGVTEINSEEVNIMTIEDPVEYKLPGIAQIGVNPKIGLFFSTGLRHILRQDPDVIMIGEIRDRETGEIAIQSSLTGHLVLTTLHTNDAPSALTRLVDMGIPPYLLASSVLAILAQRLVRCICKNCKTPYQPSNQELADLGLKHHQLKNGVLFKGAGCLQCFGCGYKDRCGIYELMPMNQAVKNQLLKSAESTHLQQVALSQGMHSLRASGAHLVLEGVTTTAEVLRVTRQLELYT